MKRTTNPEREFNKTPDLKSESEIVKVTLSERRRGIILDSPEEFAAALTAYGTGIIPECLLTTHRLYKDIGEDTRCSDKGMAVALAVLMGTTVDNDAFLKELTESAIKGLKEKGWFRQSYDYTFNKFQKTNITGKKVEDKYILELGVAYVGDKPEIALAEALKRERALISADIEVEVSLVDDWWFNINFARLLKPLALESNPQDALNLLPQHFAVRDFEPELKFWKKNGKTKLSVGFRVDGKGAYLTYLKPEKQDPHGKDYRYLQARNKNLVGGSWTDYEPDGNTKCAHRAVPTIIAISVRPYDSEYIGPPAVTPKSMQVLFDMQEQLADLLQKVVVN